jgi:hypothetical protein
MTFIGHMAGPIVRLSADTRKGSGDVVHHRQFCGGKWPTLSDMMR